VQVQRRDEASWLGQLAGAHSSPACAKASKTRAIAFDITHLTHAAVGFRGASPRALAAQTVPTASSDHPVLVADVGGTHARFGLVRQADAPVSEVATFKTKEHASLQEAAHAYLRGLPEPARPVRAALALAAPIVGETVQMTNLAWRIDSREVATSLQLGQVRLLNDFEALALALPALGDADLAWIGPARADRSLPMAVIGPGTGLGVASCVPSATGWIALAGEGGHATAAPHDDFESEVLRAARGEHRHVSAERLLSGLGLPLLHRAVCTVRGVPLQALTAEEISRRALQDGDADCAATIDTFCAMLGGFAGNVALTVGARGGVFVAGGIAHKLGSFFTGSRFRERFEDKGRCRPYLGGIATALITAPHAALTGAAQALRHPPPR